MRVCVCSRETAANDESMATVLFTNLLSQLDRVRTSEMNFLQRHNMKIIQQQLQVSPPSPVSPVSAAAASNSRESPPPRANGRIVQEGATTDPG